MSSTARCLSVLLGFWLALPAAWPGAPVAADTPSVPTLPITGRVELAAAGASSSGRAGLRVQLLPAWAEYYRGLVDLGHLPAPEPVQTVVPAADGSFELTAPAPGVWTVRVSAPGFVTMERGLRPVVEPFELDTVELKRDVGLDVQVLDPEGAPRVGVWVGVLPSQAGWRIWETARAGRWLPARRLLATDGDGRVRMPRAPGEELAVRAARPGGPVSVELSASGGLVVVRLGTGRAWELTVHDPLGEPVPNVSVRLGAWRWPAGYTDAAGRLALALPVDGESVVWLSTEAGWKIRVPVSPPDGSVAAILGPLSLQVGLPEPVRISGEVRDRDTGEPLADALVWQGADARELVFTDARGRFETEAAPVEKIVVSAALPRYRAYRTTVDPASGGARDLRLLLRSLMELSGVVLDPERRPVVGARVLVRRATRYGGPWSGRHVQEGASGPEGRFFIADQPSADRLELRVEAEGYAPFEQILTRVQAESELEIVLPQGLRIVGEVLAEDGQPLTGSRVRLFQVREQRFLRGRGGEDFQTVAGPDGRFVVAPLPAARFVVEIRHPGYAAAVLRGVDTLPVADEGSGSGSASDRTVDLGSVVLEPGAAIEGRVLGAGGEPVAGARLQTHRSRFRHLDALGRAPPSGDPEAETDADGYFRLPDFQNGTVVTLEIEAEGYADVQVSGVSAPTEPPLEIELERGGRLFGRVRDASGRPVVGARIQAKHVATRVDPTGVQPTQQTTESGDDGGFAFESLPSGRASLEVRARGFAPWRSGELVIPGAEAEIVELQPGLGPIEVTLERGVLIEGRVTAPRGEAANGAEILWRTDSSDPQYPTGAAQTLRAHTDTDGWYRIEGAVPVSGELTATLGLARAQRKIEPSGIEHRFDLQLETAPGVTGRVVDGVGQPVARAQINARPLDFRTSWHSASSGEDGRFDLVLEPGEYQLSASKPGWADAYYPGRLRVPEGPVEGIELTLVRGARIVGRIEGLSTIELGRLRILARAASPEGRILTGEARVGGTYQIAGVAPGRWRVLARLDDGARAAGGVVEVPSNAPEIRLDLELEPAVSLTGRVLRNGEPREGLRVALDRLRSDDLDRVSIQTHTDSAGRFAFAELDPGAYRLRVHHGQGWEQAREIDLRTDRDLLLESISTRVSGRLTTADGEPVTGGWVGLASTDPTGGDAGSRAVNAGQATDAEGRFVLHALPEGMYRVTVISERFSPKTFEVSVAGLEVDLGDIPLDAGAGLSLVPRMASNGAIPTELYVSLFADGGGRPVLSRQVTLTDGVARLADAPVGSWRMVVAATGTLPAILSVTLPEGGLPEPLGVVLEPASELRLRVPELQRLGGEAQVVVRDSTGRPFRGVPVPGLQTSGVWPLHRGTLRLSPLPPDTWSVEVRATDGRQWSGQVTTEPGATGELVLE